MSESKPTNPKDAVGVRKAPMSTVSAAVMAEVGVAMLEGAAKYGRHNYRAVGVRASVYYDATLRHLFSWWEGENIDPDSGMSHITKAITSLVVLRDAMIQGKVTDDRAPCSAEFYAALNARAAAILDRHADKSPRHYTINSAPCSDDREAFIHAYMQAVLPENTGRTEEDIRATAESEASLHGVAWQLWKAGGTRGA